MGVVGISSMSSDEHSRVTCRARNQRCGVVIGRSLDIFGSLGPQGRRGGNGGFKRNF
ncbi:hypothetical protein PanWU01x14_105390 [Parasponia andersonii]|uniref:Uncharacterized protein n=1 Tax=Parasponia andersonii TaxID=3476 RepID=A0A2P5D1G3_PARAD|nr:hypothetical protein PanWU01x14_105390 [Parasponia andersonii]